MEIRLKVIDKTKDTLSRIEYPISQEFRINTSIVPARGETVVVKNKKYKVEKIEHIYGDNGFAVTSASHVDIYIR